jgi:hypothetical protein
MKRMITIVAYLALTAICPVTLLAQPIQVDCSTGNVGIKTPPSSSYNLKVNNVWIDGGTIRNAHISNPSYHASCTYHGEFGNLYFDIDHLDGPSLYPVYNNRSSLGINGNAFKHIYGVQGVVETSDARKKENVRDIKEALELILQLKPVKYDWKKDFAYNDSLVRNSVEKERLEIERKNKFGFLAQDVIKIIPEVVDYDDSTDNYGIIYTNLIPVLTQAIKEQQQQIETLKALLTAQEADLIGLKSNGQKSVTIDNTGSEQSDGSAIYQNTPNPFNQSTEIKYYLAADVVNALISVCNLNGTQLKSIPINQTGEGSVTIDRETLQPGIYLYALVANGELVDTKKMMITE